jgi:hypothetical protein
MNTTYGIISELKAVDEIIHALDVTLHETAGPETCTCIRHGVEFLEDHLRRLYRLEESEGLPEIILSVHPGLAAQAHRLQDEY